ncbi:MAG TPA: hypothetical protein VGW12_01105 [Pyrinomonadaceae bacterium]|nr:hypothetical protein [Pyrinomonadaceae bacterium]
MKRIFSTLLKSACIGLVCGMIFGFISGEQMYSNAVERARDMHPADAGTYLCSAGKAPFALAILGFPAGALTGLSIGGLMLLFRAVTGRARLP